MGRSSKGPCLDCLSSYDGATSTARTVKALCPDLPRRLHLRDPLGEFQTEFDELPATLSGTVVRFLHDFGAFSTTPGNFGRAACRVCSSDEEEPKQAHTRHILSCSEHHNTCTFGATGGEL